MKTETIKPPLGYRLAVLGDVRREGVLWECAGEWLPINMEDPDPELYSNLEYAIPLDDGYEYFEARTTTVQEGDECCPKVGGWRRYLGIVIGHVNLEPLRRPKAKPSPIATGNNPHGLTLEQVGEGYRLLREDEINEHYQDRSVMRKGIQAWLPESSIWDDDAYNGDSFRQTYRVPIGWGEDPIAKGRNLAGLTESQVGVADGWRLIEDSEMGSIPNDCQRWSLKHQSWVESIYRGTSGSLVDTYRTKTVPITPPRDQQEKTYTTVRIDNGIYNIPNRFAPIIKELLQEIGGMG